jgi:hypothetical protein
MEPLSKDLRQRITNLLLHGELDHKVLDLSRPVDLFILEKLSFYRIEQQLMAELGVDNLSEDSHNNCMIDMYVALKKDNRIQNPPKYLPE